MLRGRGNRIQGKLGVCLCMYVCVCVLQIQVVDVPAIIGYIRRQHLHRSGAQVSPKPSSFVEH